MRIKRIYVDGFGIFNDFEINDISSGLSVIKGDNESGKSTLFNLICQVLFGFKRKTHPEYYPPLRGGSHGGRLTIVDEKG